ncbi:L-rhamnose-binding lectin CSL3-like [Exaiptasia diaphana]|uniref:SUEL-type lectin domain-containing protein n=1 Tax=Exaiptasia diaphana TaxID=2652724 RepID=A0A913YNP3_EXADI|nr:L-rhamnose-binding lectin CSL3-like [Exaiptasia diaphana]
MRLFVLVFLCRFTLVMNFIHIPEVSRKAIICEGSKQYIHCPDRSYIVITKANYGRTSKTTCGRERQTKCLFSVSTKLKTKCDGIRSCFVNPTNKFFGHDPCRGVAKYLEVWYKCRAILAVYGR